MAVARRSRRRRTFGAFASPSLRLTAADPAPAGAWAVTSHGRDTGPAAPAAGPDRDEIVARLRREAAADARLRARVSTAALDHLIAEAAGSFWQESRVKTLVPLLAMRRVRERLGIAVDERAAQTTDAAG